LRCERITFSFRRHFHLRHEPGDIVDERTFRALAGNHGDTGIAALEQRRAIVHAKAAFGFLRPMAFEAGGVEDGLDVAQEIDGVCRGGGKFGFVDGGGEEGKGGEEERREARGARHED